MPIKRGINVIRELVEPLDADVIKVPNPITNSFIREKVNELVFIYAYDLVKRGAQGQCVVAHGEPNCFPVYTTRNGCKSSGYFQDSMIDEIKHVNMEQISLIVESANGRPIIPFPKIGRGHSRMFEFAPKSYEWLMKVINEIAYPKIKRIYAR